MSRGGKREGGGRPPLDKENKTVRISIKVTENIEEDIEKYGEGLNKSEKIRDILEKGIEKAKENQEK